MRAALRTKTAKSQLHNKYRLPHSENNITFLGNDKRRRQSRKHMAKPLVLVRHLRLASPSLRFEDRRFASWNNLQNIHMTTLKCLFESVVGRRSWSRISPALSQWEEMMQLSEVCCSGFDSEGFVDAHTVQSGRGGLEGIFCQIQSKPHRDYPL